MTHKATFRPHERLKSPDDFRRAFERKRSASDPALVVHGVENKGGPARLGISVAKKRFRAASARNRLKRLIREAFRLNKDALPRGLDLVVIPRNARLTLDEAERSLKSLARDVARRLKPRLKPESGP